jgi:hypothetical protein
VGAQTNRQLGIRPYRELHIAPVGLQDGDGGQCRCFSAQYTGPQAQGLKARLFRSADFVATKAPLWPDQQSNAGRFVTCLPDRIRPVV